MAKNTQLANATVNAQADILSGLLNNGYLRIYDGTQAATADTAIGAQVMLSEHRFSATAAPSATAGVITFNAITTATAAASGTASWFRALKSDGTTVVFDGSVGLATANLVLSAVVIGAGASVSISSCTHTVQKSTSGL